MIGKDCCYMHGGRSRAGALSPSYKHGLYSRYLPSRFSELFKALEGRDLLDLTEDIKLLHSRLMDIAKRLDGGESGERWREALKAWSDLAQAEEDAKPGILERLGQILTAGASDWEAWEKIEELVVKKTKVVESQRKRAVEAHEMLAADEARALMRALADAVKRHVTDPGILSNISADWTRLTHPGHRGPITAREQ